MSQATELDLLDFYINQESSRQDFVSDVVEIQAFNSSARYTGTHQERLTRRRTPF